MLKDYKPYKTTVAYYISPQDEFDKLIEKLDNMGINYICKDLCEGGSYLELDVNELSEKERKELGVELCNVDIVVVQMDI